MLTEKEAIDKKYLEEKTISLKPSPRGVKMGIGDPKHIAYFQIDQGSTFFCLPATERGDLVNVFKDDEERLFFEERLGLNLNPAKPGNYFETLTIQVIKDSALMYKGFPFNLKDPMDNLRYRVVKANKDKVADSWENRKKRVEYRWALVDNSKEVEKAADEYDSKMEFWKLAAKHSDTPELRSLLKVYFHSIGSTKVITSDLSKQMLMKELNAIGEDDKQRSVLLNLVSDSLFSMKEMVIQALEIKAITKQGTDVYVLTGEDRTYTFNEIAKMLSDSKNEDSDIYFKIKSQIENNNK